MYLYVPDYQSHRYVSQSSALTFDGLRFQSLFLLLRWGEFLKYSAGVFTFLLISKIHPNTEIRDRNLSPSKVVTFLYVGTGGTYLWVGIIH